MDLYTGLLLLTVILLSVSLGIRIERWLRK